VRFLSQPGISSVGITTGLGALAIESLQSHEPALQFANADDIPIRSVNGCLNKNKACQLMELVLELEET
jgi:hypothetical protein